MASKQKIRKDSSTAARQNTVKSKSNEDFIQMPLMFARELLRQATYNPQKTSSKKSVTFSLMKREDILKWLQSPSSETNEKNLRNASNYMYVASMHYSRLLHYYAGLYTGAYVLSPLAFDKESVKKDAFKKQYYKVTKAFELMNIPHLLREILLVTLREGAFYGVLVSDNETSFVYKLDADYCKITAICDGSLLYKVDMTKIANNLECYPAIFTKMHANYLATGDKWQEVPIEMSVCIKADNTNIYYTTPPFASVMPSLYTIANTEALQETATELKNYKMLSAQIPYDEKGNPLIDNDLVEKYYAHIANALDENVGLAVTPFKFDSFSFDGNNNNKSVDDVSNAVANFWSTAGTSGLLHGRENDTSGVTKLSIKNDETFVLAMVQQFERVLNRYLKTNFTGSIKFRVNVLPVTVFNKEEMLTMYKEAASFGIGKSHYAAALGIPQSDLAGLNYIEQEVMPFDELTPMKNSFTTSSDDAGRPKAKDGDLGAAGEKTRDNDTNANK